MEELRGTSGGEMRNCYNIGNVTMESNQGAAGILGQDYYKKVVLTNCYYLSGTAALDVGNKTEVSRATNKDFLINEFMETANEEEEVYAIYDNKNDGYPCIKEIEE